MYDPLNIQKNVRQIIADNKEAISNPNKVGGWVRIDPFPVVINSIQYTELLYINSKKVYLWNGVPNHPWEMRNKLIMEGQSIPVKEGASLPANPQVKGLIDNMFAELFPFAQYDFGTHKVHLWVYDEDNAPYTYAVIPLPFFYYEYDIIRLIIMSQPDKDRMEELWEMMMAEAKKGYYYSYDPVQYRMWELIFVGYDVMQGKSRFKGNGNTYYIYTLNDITTPIISTSDNQFSGAVTVGTIRNAIGDNNLSEDARKKLNDFKTSTTFNQGNTGGKKQENTGWKNQTNETTIPQTDTPIKTEVTFDDFTKFLMTQPYNLEENSDKYIQNYKIEKIEELQTVHTVPTTSGTRVDTLHDHFLPYYTSKDFSKLGASILFDQGVLNNMVLYIISGKPDLYFIAFPPIIKLLVDSKDNGESFPSNTELLAIVSGKARRAGGTSIIQEIQQNPIYLSIIQHIPDTDEYAVATQYGFYRVNQVQAKNIIGQITDMLNHKGDNKKEDKKEDKKYNEEVKEAQGAKVNEKASVRGTTDSDQPSTEEQKDKIKQDAKEQSKEVDINARIADLTKKMSLTYEELKELSDYYFNKNQTQIDLRERLTQGRTSVVNEIEKRLKSTNDYNQNLGKYQNSFSDAVLKIEDDLGMTTDKHYAWKVYLTTLYQSILADRQLAEYIFPKNTKVYDRIKDAERDYLKSPTGNTELENYEDEWVNAFAKFLENKDIYINSNNKVLVSEKFGIVSYLIMNSMLFNNILSKSMIKHIYEKMDTIKPDYPHTANEIKEYFGLVLNDDTEDIIYNSFSEFDTFTSPLDSTFPFIFGWYIAQSYGANYTDSFLYPDNKDDIGILWNEDAVNYNNTPISNAKKELLASFANPNNRFQYFNITLGEADQTSIRFFELLIGIVNGFIYSLELTGNETDDEITAKDEIIIDEANKTGYVDIESLVCSNESDFLNTHSGYTSTISKTLEAKVI